jgi:hypothetical protein
MDSIERRLGRVRLFLEMLPPEGQFTIPQLTEWLNEGTDYLQLPIRRLVASGEVVLVQEWRPGRAAIWAKGKPS